jgi:hypothetical protein
MLEIHTLKRDFWSPQMIVTISIFVAEVTPKNKIRKSLETIGVTRMQLPRKITHEKFAHMTSDHQFGSHVLHDNLFIVLELVLI